MGLIYNSCYCSVCAKEFVDANALSDHERQVHKEENLYCKICGKLETNSYTLNGHMQNHETRLCKVCNANVPRKNFARHMEKHNEVVYSCDICNVNFTRKDALKRHKGSHDKPENDSPPIIVAKKKRKFFIVTSCTFVKSTLPHHKR